MSSEMQQAVKAAQFATLDLVGLMAAHRLGFPTLNLILEPGWPPIVKQAFEEWATTMNDVAKTLTAHDGIEPGARLSDADRDAYTQRAYSAVMDS